MWKILLLVFTAGVIVRDCSGLLQSCLDIQRDVIMVLDSSAIIAPNEFQSAKKALQSIFSYFIISPTSTRLSFIKLGERVELTFDFLKYSTFPTLSFGVLMTKPIGGNLIVGDNLVEVLSQLANSTRNDSEKFLLLILHSQNINDFKPTKEVSKLVEKGFKIISVVIGNETKIPDLVSKATLFFPTIKAMETNPVKVVNEFCPATVTEKEQTPTVTLVEKVVTTASETKVETTTTAKQTTVTAKMELTTPKNTTVTPKQPVATESYPRTTVEPEGFSTLEPTLVTPEAEECSNQRVDLMFALDASSSLSPNHWKQELNLASRITNNLEIGVTKSLVGMVAFSDYIETTLELGTILEKQKIMNTIKQQYFLEGGTFIADALIKCHEILQKRGRPDVKKTIVLVTDGEDNSPNKSPEVEAQKIKLAGTKILVVGIGFSISKKQLENISSTETFFSITDANKIDLFDPTMLSKEACHVEKPIPKCQAQLDLIFLIDSSSQVSQNEWAYQIEFSKKLAKLFELGTNSTRISIMQFATEANIVLDFSVIPNDITKAFDRMNYTGGGLTFIDLALKLAKTKFYLNARPTSRKIIVLLSNGLTKDQAKAIGAAYDLQEEGIEILAVGTNEHADKTALKILSSPNMVFLRNEVKEEKTLLIKAVSHSCIKPSVPTNNICDSNGDIIFILDKSVAVADYVWDGIKSLLLTTIRSMNVSETTTRISIVTYAESVKTEFRLDDNYSAKDVYVAVKQLKQEGKGGRLDLALARTRQLFKISNRYNFGKVAVVVTDNLPDQQKNVKDEARDLEMDGVRIVTVGLSPNSPYSLFEEIVAKKDVVRIDNINNIDKHTAQLKQTICEVFTNRKDECSQKKLDAIITMDSSTSIGPDSWKIQLDFVSRIAGLLDLRRDRTRLGIFTFASDVDLKIPINSTFSKEEIQKEIIKVPYVEGSTAIGWAISNATFHFKQRGRPDIPKVLVILTDGANTRGEPPQIAAVEAKRENIKIITVGIGNEISEKELKDIATSREYYSVKNFKDLEKYNAKTITMDACQVPEKPKTCIGAGDVIFIMGSGADKGTDKFEKMASFMTSLTKLINIHRDFTRVAVLKFNKGAYHDSGFTDDVDNFEKAVQTMTSTTNGVYIGKALERAKALFDSDERKKATKTVIVMVDSEITDRNVTFQQAEIIKKGNIKIITISLSPNVSTSDLRLIASNGRFIEVKDVKHLNDYRGYVVSEICEVIKGTSKECSNKQLDLMIALDSSSSVGPIHWKSELSFVERIIGLMDIGEDMTRVGLVTFNTESTKQFGLSKYSDKYEIISTILKVQYDEGATAIGDALRDCKEELLNNSRRGVPRAILLITDGVAQGGISPEVESTIIKKYGIKIIVVGIGDAISANQLKALSSSGTYHTVLGMKTLQDYDTFSITRDSCEVGKASQN